MIIHLQFGFNKFHEKGLIHFLIENFVKLFQFILYVNQKQLKMNQ
jgi:hypothetical protein